MQNFSAIYPAVLRLFQKNSAGGVHPPPLARVKIRTKGSRKLFTCLCLCIGVLFCSTPVQLIHPYLKKAFKVSDRLQQTSAVSNLLWGPERDRGRGGWTGDGGGRVVRRRPFNLRQWPPPVAPPHVTSESQNVRKLGGSHQPEWFAPLQ